MSAGLPRALLLLTALAPATVWAQEVVKPDSTTAADTTARPADETKGLKLGSLPFYLSGYVTSTFTYSFAATGNQLVGRFYDRYQDQFMANGVELGITKPVDTSKLDAGMRAELLFGQDAAVTQSAGLSLGPDGDLTEAYVTLNVPLAKGKADHWMQFKLGKMWSIMGYEVIDDVLDPNLDVGNQFIYLTNFTNTGLGVDFKFGPRLDAEFRIINGWDVVVDNNSALSFMGRIGYNPSANVTMGLVGYAGAEQPDNDSNLRYGLEFLGTFKLDARTSLIGQFDYGEEQGLLPDPDQNAKWWGGGVWITHDLSPIFNLALRGDYVDDENGVRSSGVLGYAPVDARRFGSVTATLNIHAFPKATIRPEFRVDFSSLNDYGEVDDPKSTQPSVGIGATYQF